MFKSYNWMDGWDWISECTSAMHCINEHRSAVLINCKLPNSTGMLAGGNSQEMYATSALQSDKKGSLASERFTTTHIVNSCLICS